MSEVYPNPVTPHAIAKTINVGKDVANPKRKKQDNAPPNADRRIVLRSDIRSLSMPMSNLPKMEDAAFRVSSRRVKSA